MSSQCAHVRAVSLIEDSEDLSDPAQKQFKDFVKKADIHDSEKSDSDESVNVSEAFLKGSSAVICH